MRLDAPSPTQLHAFVATILTNLVGFAAWVVEWGAWWPFQAAIKRRLRSQLRRGFQAFARIAFLLAAHRIEAPKPRTHALTPANAPSGFRMQSARSKRRFLHLSGLNQGAIKARIARLNRMLENIELWAGRLLKRLRPRKPALYLVLTHAIAEACADPIAAPRAHAADTS